MKKHSLSTGGSAKSGGTGASRHEKTMPVTGGSTGLVTDAGLNGPNSLGEGTGNSRHVSTAPGTPQVIGGGSQLKTNSATPGKGLPDQIGVTRVVTNPRRPRR